jgi:hypothetical protein
MEARHDLARRDWNRSLAVRRLNQGNEDLVPLRPRLLFIYTAEL